MTPRYLIVLSRDRAAAASLEDIAHRADMTVALKLPELAILVNPFCHVTAIGAHGALLGPVFNRHGPGRAVETIEPGEAEAIHKSAGQFLLKSFWGGYLAVLARGEAPRILREPSGAMPCYFLKMAGDYMFASDVELLLEASGRQPRIDWAAMARHLRAGDLPGEETVLDTVKEVPPGFMVEVSRGGLSAGPCWSPWDHVGTRDDCDLDAQVDRLRRAVTACVHSWASTQRRLLLSVSGGLDSSIVAACLAGHSEVTCLTVYGDDPRGDERAYARALCAHLGLELIERRYALDEIDIEAPFAVHLPRPLARLQAQFFDRTHVELAADRGVGAFISGNGGDNVFAYSQSAAPIVDRFHQEGAGAGVLRTLVDTCRQTGCGPLQAARAALRIAWTPARERHWRSDLSFLHPDVVAAARSDQLAHPWLDAPPSAVPGKWAQIVGLLRAQHTLEPARSRFAPLIQPLLAQPLIELCLAIPTWQWRAGGVNRAVARRAFARDLPELIVGRRVKGGPDGFSVAIIDRHRARIRDRLLGGHLAREGLLDLPALGTALDGRRPDLGDEQVRLQELFVTETWLDYWLSRSVGPSRSAARPNGRARLAERAPRT